MSMIAAREMLHALLGERVEREGCMFASRPHSEYAYNIEGHVDGGMLPEVEQVHGSLERLGKDIDTYLIRRGGIGRHQLRASGHRTRSLEKAARKPAAAGFASKSSLFYNGLTEALDPKGNADAVGQVAPAIRAFLRDVFDIKQEVLQTLTTMAIGVFPEHLPTIIDDSTSLSKELWDASWSCKLEQPTTNGTWTEEPWGRNVLTGIRADNGDLLNRVFRKSWYTARSSTPGEGRTLLFVEIGQSEKRIRKMPPPSESMQVFSKPVAIFPKGTLVWANSRGFTGGWKTDSYGDYDGKDSEGSARVSRTEDGEACGFNGKHIELLLITHAEDPILRGSRGTSGPSSATSWRRQHPLCQ
jgi:hypothetical protein